MKKEKCPHSSGTWSDWQYVEGVTSGIQFRIKTCDSCGVTIASESRAV